MTIKIYKPTTPSRRGMTGYTFDEITKDTPERSLIVLRKAHAGRNNYGRVTVRHQGAGQRQFVRIVDFKRKKLDIPAKVAAIEYDPNRTARLALLVYADGEKSYIIAPLGLKVGDTVMKTSEIRLLSTDEIKTKLGDARNELMNLRFQIVTGQLTDTSRLKIIRRQIAVYETILRERELGNVSEGAK